MLLNKILYQISNNNKIFGIKQYNILYLYINYNEILYKKIHYIKNTFFNEIQAHVLLEAYGSNKRPGLIERIK